MDVNGLRFWAISGAAGWPLTAQASHDLAICRDTGALRLVGKSDAPAVTENKANATRIADSPARVKDALDTIAFWDDVASAIMTVRDGGSPAVLAQMTAAMRPTDMTLGADDVLYVARPDGVVLIDTRGRWQPFGPIAHASFKATKLAPRAGGGAFALDTTSGSLATIIGQPLRDGVAAGGDFSAFAPVDPNLDPPRLVPQQGAALPAGWTAKAIAASPEGQLAILAWRAGAPAALFTYGDGALTQRVSSVGLEFPASLAFDGETRVALIATDALGLARSAFVYELPTGAQAAATLPAGGAYPMPGAAPERYFNVAGLRPLYATGASSFLPLRALSAIRYSRAGAVMLGPFDSGMADTVWHRLYLEAVIPAHGRIQIDLHAANHREDFADLKAVEWHAHNFGFSAGSGDNPPQDIAPLLPAANSAGAPAAAWLDAPSEIPHHPGIYKGERQPNQSGLFSVLVQRPARAVHRLAGRYVWARVSLHGDGGVTPSIAALRIYSSRFSYRDKYLAPLYHETLSGADANAARDATAPDFLDRFLCLFEEPLTQIEGQVATADLLTDPAAAPPSALPWLGSWLGLGLSETAAGDKDRQALLAAPFTARLNGTLGGLRAELELATGGVFVRGGSIDLDGVIPRPGEIALAETNGKSVACLVLSVGPPGTGEETAVLAGGRVTGGSLVIVEGFRLRRTFATILGADLADAQDPLTLGLARSGNSFVGDTLFLGDALHTELLSLFLDDPRAPPREREAIAAFLDALAWRVTVLAHGAASPAEMARLQRIADAASPAHVEVSIRQASLPLIVGVASLVGVDTFLAPPRPPGAVVLGASALGGADLLRGGGLLDRRRLAALAPPFALNTPRASGPRLPREFIWTWN